jgi:hypothetical protein
MEEQPAYSEISAEEMCELEAEFGHPLNREMALWMIRLNTNRAAIQCMLADEEKERHFTSRDLADLLPRGVVCV